MFQNFRGFDLCRSAGSNAEMARWKVVAGKSYSVYGSKKGDWKERKWGVWERENTKTQSSRSDLHVPLFKEALSPNSTLSCGLFLGLIHE